MLKLRLYSDGSSHAKGGLPIGWAWVLIEMGGDGNRPLCCGSDGQESGTNNVAELMGILHGIGRIWSRFDDFREYESLEVCSDSQYALGAASGLNAVHANAAIVSEIRRMVGQLAPMLPITFSWVRGHNGEPWQERCDSLAVRAKNKIKEALNVQKTV